jgi:nucleotide-binding universal stress UspA family protein
MPVRTVLCPTDFTPLSDRAVSLATRVCRWYGARLVLEHNLDARPPSFLSVEWMWSEEQESGDGARERAAEDHLRTEVERLAKQLPCEARLTRGPLELGLVAVARALSADLVVMGSHGWSGTGHHSLTERLVDSAPCPLLTLSHGTQAERFLSAAETEPVPVLVPLDLSPHSRATAADALELLDRLPLRLHFLHVESPRFETGEAVADFGRLEGLVPAERRGQVALHIRSGRPVDQILAAARDLDARLILMGSHGKGPLARLLTGATAREILHRAPCPVWFEPPVRARASWPMAG